MRPRSSRARVKTGQRGAEAPSTTFIAKPNPRPGRAPQCNPLAPSLVTKAAFSGALLSAREPWAVVVNEAAACGLPLVLSDRVGAAHDLLRNGENGFLVAAGDVEAASGALRRLAADGDLRSAQGARSRELARDWGYGPSVEGFLAAVREAVA